MAGKKVFFGAAALASGNVVKLLAQLLVLPILARYLGPAAYGVMALALPFIMFANMLCDGGMSAALAREQNSSRVLESTIFWISLAIGIVLSLVLCLLAGPVAQLLGEPRLGPILATMTIVLVLSSALSVPNARITRMNRFGAFGIGEVLATVIGAMVALVAAARGLGAWSLVLQQIAFWIVKVVWLVPASGFRPLLVCRPSLAKPQLRFGLHTIGANFGDFINRNVPALTIGGALGAVAVGHYALANQLARVPELIVAGALFLPVFTAAAQAQSQGAPLAAMVRRILFVTFAILAPVFCGMALVADLATSVLLGPKWVGVEGVMQLLAPGAFLVCLFMIVAAVLQGAGRPDTQFRLSMLTAGLISLGVFAGASLGSAGAAAAGISVAVGLAAVFYLRAISRQLQTPALEILGDFAQPAIATVVMAVCVLVLRHELQGVNRIVEFAAAVIIGVLTYAAVLLILRGRQTLSELRTLLPARS